MTIELAPEIEARLRETAARQGLSVEEDVVRLAVRDGGVDIAEDADDDMISDEEFRKIPVPRTPAGAIEYRNRVGAGGVFAGRGDAPELARQLREAEEASRTETRAGMQKRNRSEPGH